MSRFRTVLSAAVLAAVASACGLSPQPTPSGSTFSLPTLGVDAPASSPLACAGIGLAAVLRGGPGDPRVAWLEPTEGRRIDLVWLPGYAARFTPQIEILDPGGRVVLRDGDYVDGGCVTDDQSVMWLSPPFLAFRLDCGPIAVSDCQTQSFYQIATANGWPERQIAELHFLTTDGQYRLVFEDGSTALGKAPP